MDKRHRSPSRQCSCTMLRHKCAMQYILLSPACRLCLCISLIFGTGFIVGMLLNEHLLSSSPTTRLSTFGKLGPTVEVSPSSEKARAGSSVKKDLKFQVKDYIPRHVFINCAAGPPWSLELFLETYPDSFRYDLYTFLADASYKRLYDKFENLKLFSATVLSSANNTTMLDFPDMEKPGKTVSTPVVHINFSAWLKDTFHRDDHIVVKLCAYPQNVNLLINSLVEAGALEWINKLYLSSAYSLSELMQNDEDKFDALTNKVYLWDDDTYTYSDFDAINQPDSAEEETVEVKECQGDDGSEFAVLLYMSSVNQHSRDTLSLLSKISNQLPFELPITLFLPPEFLESEPSCGNLSSLGSKMELGFYFSIYFTSSVNEFMDNQKLFNILRNRLVHAEHCFKYAELIMTYVLPDYVMHQSFLPKEGKSAETPEGTKQYKRVLYERGYAVMVGAKDMTQLVELPMEDLTQAVANAKSGLMAVDISVQGTDAFLLRMLRAHMTSLIPAHECRMKGKAKD
ncbi:hypothetical protein BaRGS_00037501 [Batillaria attramentaria]|uniref:Uncharacterized protein n=1 Tax=Batillaria attramentaria TaxID=370345 RepID=A0ABD0J8R5_9CAEN